MSTLLRRPAGDLPPTRPRLGSAEAVAVLGVLGLGVGALLSPYSIEDGPVLCPFRRLTGLPCPGCGMTRSWVYLTHGWWQDSFLAHPFGAVAAATVLTLAVLVLRARLRRTRPPSLDRLVRHPVAIGLVAAWLSFSLVRAALAL
ncbi:DUF2752 domain-containing protein [Nocardioides sp. zg-ZUI104]|uniref:DUF2752 domain-containing protein n=1 Tax=Nocardioides faecalis TaxID=2803858 RepID=UPI001BCB994C|nr:DUF2752 domain-containing protein [Nocardioides faecalis]MBS4753199.1 DUF2752 domain-containing protein [Nocardioides faecalis]